MSIRRMMLFTLRAKIKNLVQAFKERVLATQGEFEAEGCLEVQLTQLDNQSLLDSASLVVTPNGYKETLLYAVEPNEVGTNLLLRSEEFGNGYWNKTRCSIVSNVEIAPNGLQTADYVVEDNTTGLRYVGKTSEPTTVGVTWTFSFFCKKVDRNSIGIQINENNAIFPTVRFNFDTQTFTQITAGMSSSFEVYPNGWYRLIFTRTPTQGTSSVFGIYPLSISGSFNGTGDGSSRTLIWGAQLVPGSTITDYISTTDRAIINGTIGDMSVTRATTATRVNADGFIEVVPYNLLSQSQNFENGFWNKQRTTIGQNVIAAPDGTMTADNLIATIGVIYTYTGALGVNVISSSFTQRSLCTVSFYLKYNGLNRIRVMYGAASTMGGDNYVEVDLQLGIITGSNLVTNPFIENVGDDWYRVGFTDEISLATNNRFGVGLGDTVKTIANGIDGVYIWGAQLVDGSSAKDYFPTTNRFNVPRIDYSNGSCPSILVEPQRTNLVLRSEEFENASWVKDNSSILTNTAISPSNVLNADTYIGNGLNLQHFIYQNLSVTSGIAYSISIYAKKDTNNFIQLCGSNAAFGVNCFANFDISNGTIGTIGSATIASIDSVGNGWYRLKITSTAIATTPVAPILISLITSSTSIKTETNNLSTSVYLWGAQLEAGTNATSYIPTVASTVTRNADVITNTNASTLIGQSEGSVYLEFYHSSSITANIELFNLWNGVSSYIIRSRINSAGANSFSTIYAGNGGILHPSFNLVPNSINKVVIIYDYAINTSKVFHNGVLIGLTVGIQPYPTTLQDKVGIGSWFGNANSNTQRQIAIWKTKLTDTQAIQLTTL